jgi:hypothetical protein
MLLANITVSQNVRYMAQRAFNRACEELAIASSVWMYQSASALLRWWSASCAKVSATHWFCKDAQFRTSNIARRSPDGWPPPWGAVVVPARRDSDGPLALDAVKEQQHDPLLVRFVERARPVRRCR